MVYIELLDSINDSDMKNILEVWESSVRATHNFLNEDNITHIRPFVKEGIDNIENLFCARNNNGVIVAFIGIHNKKIEMLFVHNDYRGKGIGKRLVMYGLSIFTIEYVDVNEQNPAAIGFYEYMGFETFKRSEFDEQGNPFPILHMKLKMFYI
ncbi:MAG: GNAT family N-acetyltransferase [Peptostreptococcaceae bacterium]